jgi:hypothetical protein
MIILPEATPQTIRFRSRPHEAQLNYWLVAWTNSEKVFALIEPITYLDGHVEGAVTLPIAVGLANGAKINLRVFPVTGDGTALMDAMEAATDRDPFYLSIHIINTFILNQIDAGSILPEVYRGQIFVSTKTEQPYNVT